MAAGFLVMEEPVTTLRGKTITRTGSICPECNRNLPARVFERDGKVWMTKACPDHGEFEDLYFGSYEMYQKFSRYLHNGKGIDTPHMPLDKCDCPRNCGLCSSHLSHTGLANLVVTNRCDLTCWYCFFYVKKGVEGAYVYEPTLDQIRQMARTLRAERPVPGNAVQVTGGEPTLRKDLPEIVKIIKEEGVDHVQVNSDGINLALDPNLAATLREAGVNTVYMSFDGVTPKTNPKNHWEAPVAIDNCRKAGLGIVLVPTIIRTVNDHELGDIIRFGFKNIDIIRSVNFQPVSLTGRLTKSERMKYRITIPDCIKRIEEQTHGQVTEEAFFPVPSCIPITHFVEALTGKARYELSIHFACGAATYIFKNGERFVPITDFVDIEGLLEYLQDRADEMEAGANRYLTTAKVLFKIGSFIDKRKQPKGLSLAKILFNTLIKHDYHAMGELHKRSLFIGMMHFQDKYNHDEERLKRCDIHYLTPDNHIIPFCAFNVIPEWYRDPVQAKFSVPVEEWEKQNNTTLEESLYKGTLRKGEHHPGCGCAIANGPEAQALQLIT